MGRIRRNSNTGQYGEQQEDGSIRVINNAKELSELGVMDVRDEQGVTFVERVVLKNFARNPAMGAEYLRSRGYDVMQYGSGLNYAVRRDSEEPWRIVDPQRAGFGEFFKDLADLSTDVLGVGAITAGTVAGAGLASAATGAGTAVGFELLRQSIGQSLGIEENFKPLSFETAVQGVGGGIAPGAGALVSKGVSAAVRTSARATGAITRVVGEATEFIAGVVGGIKPKTTLGITQSLLERAAAKTGGRYAPLTHPEDAVALARKVIDAVANPHPSSNMSLVTSARNNIVNDGIKAGKTADLSAVREQLKSVADVLSPRTLPKTPGAADFSGEAVALKNQIRTLINPPTLSQFKGAGIEDDVAQKAFDQAFSAWENSFKKVNLKAAVEIKDLLQNWVSSKQGFKVVTEGGAGPNEVTKKFIRDVGALSGKINGAVRSRLPKKYGDLNAELGRKIEAVDFARNHFGSDKEGAERFVSGLLKGDQGDQVRALRQFDTEFGTDLFKMFREANLGLQFTPATKTGAAFGTPRLAPRLGATGQILTIGLPVSLGAGSGFLVGDEAGAVAGGAVGLTLASPRTMVRLAPGLVKASQGIQSISASAAKSKWPGLVTSHTTQISILGSVQAAARSVETSGSKQTDRTDGPKKRGRLNLSQ